MKRTFFYLFIALSMVITSCSSFGKKSRLESKEMMAKQIEEIKAQFGSKNGLTPAFSSIIFMYDKQAGDIISVTGNCNITSNQVVQKLYMLGKWKIDDETITIDKENPEDVLFTLNEVDLMKIPGIVTDANNFVKKKYNYSDVSVSYIGLISTTSKKDLEYSVIVKTDNDKEFKGSYDLTGKIVQQMVKN